MTCCVDATLILNELSERTTSGINFSLFGLPSVGIRGIDTLRS